MKANQLKKIAIITVPLVMVSVVGVFIFLNSFLTSKIKEAIENKFADNIQLSYDEIDVSTFAGTVKITNINARIHNKIDSIEHTKLAINMLQLKGFSYTNYFFKNKIHFDKITIFENKLSYYPAKYRKDTTTIEESPKIKLIKSLTIGELRVINSKIAFYDATADSIALYVPTSSLIIKNIYADPKTVLNNIPITYSSLSSSADSIIYKLSPYEKIKVKKLVASQKTLTLNELAIAPRFSKTAFSRQITTERDHLSLNLKELTLKEFTFGFENNLFYLKAPHLQLIAPQLAVYRDKLIADDTSYKPLYSKTLRQLPIKLQIDTATIKNGRVTYEERTTRNNQAGVLSFHDVDATMNNLCNLKACDAPTSIHIKTLFQNSAHLQLDWSFNVNNTKDTFTITGAVGTINAATLNSFTHPNLNATFEGLLHKTNFNIQGNDVQSTTKVRMEYDDLKLLLMRKNKPKKVNHLKTAIANLFIKKNSKSDEKTFEEDTAVIKRDQTKSIFNFMWISIQAAIKKILT